MKTSAGKLTQNTRPILTRSKSTIETLEKSEICSKLTIKTPKRLHFGQLRRYGVFIFNFAHILHLFLVFLLLTLNK